MLHNRTWVMATSHSDIFFVVGLVGTGDIKKLHRKKTQEFRCRDVLDSRIDSGLADLHLRM